MNTRIDTLIDTRRPMFLTDGGLETTLVFHEGWELPEFAGFTLLDSASGRTTLEAYYERYIGIALARKVGFVLESPTWRASPKWMEKIGYAAADVTSINQQAIEMMAALRARHETAHTPMVISGCIGPQDDGYAPQSRLSPNAAADYHRAQISACRAAVADLVTAVTMTYPEEAIGIARAATAEGLPVVISFTVETDGKLPVGIPLGDAILQVDAATSAVPLYYMINCAHPDHFAHALASAADWPGRIGGLRSNSSRCSHAELDEAETLDEGDPSEFGWLHHELMSKLPNLRVLGGCCGTDHRHVASIAEHCLAA